MGALDGIRVLEVGGFISGPFAGALLGDLGADVIKLEPSSGTGTGGCTALRSAPSTGTSAAS